MSAIEGNFLQDQSTYEINSTNKSTNSSVNNDNIDEHDLIENPNSSLQHHFMSSMPLPKRQNMLQTMFSSSNTLFNGDQINGNQLMESADDQYIPSTALLQKATLMGATAISNNNNFSSAMAGMDYGSGLGFTNNNNNQFMQELHDHISISSQFSDTSLSNLENSLTIMNDMRMFTGIPMGQNHQVLKNIMGNNENTSSMLMQGRAISSGPDLNQVDGTRNQIGPSRFRNHNDDNDVMTLDFLGINNDHQQQVGGLIDEFFIDSINHGKPS